MCFLENSPAEARRVNSLIASCVIYTLPLIFSVSSHFSRLQRHAVTGLIPDCSHHKLRATRPRTFSEQNVFGFTRKSYGHLRFRASVVPESSIWGQNLTVSRRLLWVTPSVRLVVALAHFPIA